MKERKPFSFAFCFEQRRETGFHSFLLRRASSNLCCTDLPTVTIEVDVKNIQYTEDEAELGVTCEVEANPPAQV
jgi:hypothetical protein